MVNLVLFLAWPATLVCILCLSGRWNSIGIICVSATLLSYLNEMVEIVREDELLMLLESRQCLKNLTHSVKLSMLLKGRKHEMGQLSSE